MRGLIYGVEDEFGAGAISDVPGTVPVEVTENELEVQDADAVLEAAEARSEADHMVYEGLYSAKLFVEHAIATGAPATQTAMGVGFIVESAFAPWGGHATARRQGLLPDNVAAPRLESVGNYNYNQEALEGLRTALVRMWEAFKRVLKQIWDAIKSWFGSFGKSAENLKKMAAELKRKAGNLGDMRKETCDLGSLAHKLQPSPEPTIDHDGILKQLGGMSDTLQKLATSIQSATLTFAEEIEKDFKGRIDSKQFDISTSDKAQVLSYKKYIDALMSVFSAPTFSGPLVKTTKELVLAQLGRERSSAATGDTAALFGHEIMRSVESKLVSVLGGSALWVTAEGIKLIGIPDAGRGTRTQQTLPKEQIEAVASAVEAAASVMEQFGKSHWTKVQEAQTKATDQIAKYATDALGTDENKKLSSENRAKFDAMVRLEKNLLKKAFDLGRKMGPDLVKWVGTCAKYVYLYGERHVSCYSQK